MKIVKDKLLVSLSHVVSFVALSVPGMMEIMEMPDVSKHNHEVKRAIAAFYPENRRPSAGESA